WRRYAGPVARLPVNGLTPQAEILDDLAIAVDLGGLEIVQQSSTLTHHAQQSAPGRVVPLVELEVLGKVVNLLSQKRDLHFRRSRVAFVRLELADDPLLLLLGERHSGDLLAGVSGG